MGGSDQGNREVLVEGDDALDQKVEEAFVQLLVDDLGWRDGPWVVTDLFAKESGA